MNMMLSDQFNRIIFRLLAWQLYFPMLAGWQRLRCVAIRSPEGEAGRNVEPRWLVEEAFLLVEAGGASLPSPLIPSLVIIQYCQEGSQLKPKD